MRVFTVVCCCLLFLGLLRGPACARAQGTVPVLMLSDIHFDPFRNPHLLPQLQKAPVAQWPAILDATPDLVEDVDRTALQLECHARATDTGWPLLKQAMAAARMAEARPAFVTLTGDLLAHAFDCRFHHLAPAATAQELSDFSAKTETFVAQQVQHAYPGVPVYVALGNNDSGCSDYLQTPGSTFLTSALKTALVGAEAGPTTHTAAERIGWEVSAGGDYSLRLPAPFAGRLIVLDDIYDSASYGTCAGQRTQAPEDVQIAWLRAQLSEAQRRHEPVWVLGHIPPGVDVYASFAKYLLRPAELCSATPRPFLADNRLADTLLDFAGTVRLGLFAHTHMDEIRLLHRATGPGGPAAVVPIKLVPSITPYFGNHPAFLVAAVDPRTLALQDWETVVAAGTDGSPLPWKTTYRYRQAFGLPDLSGAAVEDLATGFTDDHKGEASRSRTYREHFYAGDSGLYALGLEQVWPAYACSVREFDLAAFHTCLCPAVPTPAPAVHLP